MRSDNLSVLIVDDEEIVRSGLAKSECFSRLGYRVVGAASNGREALELTRQMEPDLIVTDINMPVMNGLDYLKAVRGLGNDTAALILSCYDDFSYAQKAIQLDVVSYLLKPFTDQELSDALEKVRRQLAAKRRERKALEMEEFLVNGRDSVLLTLLRQVIVHGARDEMLRNIYNMGLLGHHSHFGLALFSGLSRDMREELACTVAEEGEACYLLETEAKTEINVESTVLICSPLVSAAGFGEKLLELTGRWRQKLALPEGTMFCGEPFSSLETAHGELLRLREQAEDWRESQRQKSAGEPAGVRKEIQKAIAYIEEHLCEKELGLNSVAESIFISPYYFSRLFTQDMGMSFVRYVNALRVEKACALLRENSLHIYEISDAVGFQNETYFHQVFKGLKGVTPKKFMQQHE